MNSTLAGAHGEQAWFRLACGRVPQFDRTMPEEISEPGRLDFRPALYHGAGANENLAREGIPGDRIHFVGNVMIDTLFRYRERARASSILEMLSVESRGYSLLTLHRPSNVDTEAALRPILGAIARIQALSPVVFPVHPRTRRRLERLIGSMPGTTNLRLVDPRAPSGLSCSSWPMRAVC